MGWLYYDYKPTNVKNHLIALSTWENEDGRKTEVLDCAIVHVSTAYLAVKMTAPNGEEEVFAVIYQLDFPKAGSRNCRNGRFGYKDMDETMGPNESSCPERILKLLTPLPPAPPPLEDGSPAPDRYQYARNWRARCWANVGARKVNKAKRVLGTRLVPKDSEEIDMNLPAKVREFEVVHPGGHRPGMIALKVVDPGWYGSVLYRVTDRFLNGLRIKQ